MTKFGFCARFAELWIDGLSVFVRVAIWVVGWVGVLALQQTQQRTTHAKQWSTACLLGPHGGLVARTRLDCQQPAWSSLRGAAATTAAEDEDAAVPPAECGNTITTQPCPQQAGRFASHTTTCAHHCWWPPPLRDQACSNDRSESHNNTTSRACGPQRGSYALARRRRRNRTTLHRPLRRPANGNLRSRLRGACTRWRRCCRLWSWCRREQRRLLRQSAGSRLCSGDWCGRSSNR